MKRRISKKRIKTIIRSRVENKKLRKHVFRFLVLHTAMVKLMSKLNTKSFPSGGMAGNSDSVCGEYLITTKGVTNEPNRQNQGN